MIMPLDLGSSLQVIAAIYSTFSSQSSTVSPPAGQSGAPAIWCNLLQVMWLTQNAAKRYIGTVRKSCDSVTLTCPHISLFQFQSLFPKKQTWPVIGPTLLHSAWGDKISLLAAEPGLNGVWFQIGSFSLSSQLKVCTHQMHLSGRGQ